MGLFGLLQHVYPFMGEPLFRSLQKLLFSFPDPQNLLKARPFEFYQEVMGTTKPRLDKVTRYTRLKNEAFKKRADKWRFNI